MNNNQTLKQTKSDPKGKAIVSLILGIVSGIPTFILLISGYFSVFLLGIPIVNFIVYLVVPLMSIAGIILGLVGLKSTKKNIAIGGIVVSLISLGTSIYAYLLLFY